MKPCLCRVNEIFCCAADGIISQFYSKLNSVRSIHETSLYRAREKKGVKFDCCRDSFW